MLSAEMCSVAAPPCRSAGKYQRALCALLALLWGAEAAAAAQTPRLDLTLEAPPGCPSSAEVISSVEALVRTTPAEPLKVSAQIVQQGARWAVSAQWDNGQRRVQGDSCEGVTQALIAIVALAIDPSAEIAAVGVPRTDSPEPSPHPHPEAVPPTQAASEPAAVAPAPPRRPVASNLARASVQSETTSTGRDVEFGGSLLALGEWGSLPAASYGATGIVRGALQPWSAELGGSWLRAQWAQVTEVSDHKGGYISWMSVQANGCHALGRWAAACAGVEVGELRGEGENVATQDSEGSLWLAAAFTALARLPLGAGFSAEARAVAAFPVYRPAFSIDPYDPLHRPNWLSGRLSLGIGFR